MLKIMADQLGKPSFKHYPECEQKPETKRQKRQKNNESDNTKNAAAIDNICNELLERILDLLDLQSLLSMANTCKHLKVAATTKFGQKLGHRLLFLYSNVQRGIGAVEQIGFEIDGDNIYVHAPVILPFLRCFGAKISNLKVCRTDNHVNKYINRYCDKTVTSIEFWDHSETLTRKNFPKPFKAVERLGISGNFQILGKKFLKFPGWFPNLRHLAIEFGCLKFDLTAVNFPHLDDLTVNDPRHMLKEETAWYLIRLLRANPQLRAFDLDCTRITSLETVVEIISGNRLIVDLRWKSIYLTHASAAELLRFADEHPMMVNLCLGNVLEVEDIIIFVRKLTLLKSFECSLDGTDEYFRLKEQIKNVPGFQDITRTRYGAIMKFNR